MLVLWCTVAALSVEAESTCPSPEEIVASLQHISAVDGPGISKIWVGQRGDLLSIAFLKPDNAIAHATTLATNGDCASRARAVAKTVSAHLELPTPQPPLNPKPGLNPPRDKMRDKREPTKPPVKKHPTAPKRIPVKPKASQADPKETSSASKPKRTGLPPGVRELQIKVFPVDSELSAPGTKSRTNKQGMFAVRLGLGHNPVATFERPTYKTQRVNLGSLKGPGAHEVRLVPDRYALTLFTGPLLVVPGELGFSYRLPNSNAWVGLRQTSLIDPAGYFSVAGGPFIRYLWMPSFGWLGIQVTGGISLGNSLEILGTDDGAVLAATGGFHIMLTEYVMLLGAEFGPGIRIGPEGGGNLVFNANLLGVRIPW